jgi:hypothetical protein
VRGQHPVREAGIGLQRAVLHQFDGPGPELSWGTTWSLSPFMARTGTVIFFKSSL